MDMIKIQIQICDVISRDILKDISIRILVNNDTLNKVALHTNNGEFYFQIEKTDTLKLKIISNDYKTEIRLIRA